MTQTSPDTRTAHVIRSDEEALKTARALANGFAEGDSYRDAERVLPATEMDKLSASGLLGITVPKEHGGADVRAVTLGEVIRRLSAADGSIGQIPQNHFFFVEVLREAASPEQREFFYAELLAGRRFGNAIAEKGSKHALDLQTRFERVPGGYKINGTKNYATGALFAHWIPIYANDDDGKLHAAYLPRDAPGLTVVDDWEGMGQRITASGTVRLEDVFVPDDRVVEHWRTFDRTEIFGAYGQYMHAAIDAGIAEAAMRDAKTFVHATSRPWGESGVERASEEPLIIQQFGELALQVRAANALLREAGLALDAARAALREDPNDEAAAAEASAAVAAARAQADTASVRAANELFALGGTKSASMEANLHRHWRNARTHTLHDPRRWKVQHLGNYALNDVPPPRSGIV